MAEINKGGRPPKYTNVDDLSLKIDEYFIFVQGEKISKEIENLKTGEIDVIDVWIRYPERITITGLALFLGFDSKSTLYEYQKKARFSYPIKRGILKVEQQYESNLYERNPAGAIFALKNFGWKDKSEVDVDHTTGGDKIQWVENKTYSDNGKDSE
ncbi:terminase small subunit [Pedobacter immunditicola]|uniref:terminase small subunit n=1 Tax=Pedobacter immunditicola TaxID=3133440 RepID=UPI0030A7A06A